MIRYYILMRSCDILMRYCEKAYKECTELYESTGMYPYRVEASRYKKVCSLLRELKSQIKYTYNGEDND